MPNKAKGVTKRQMLTIAQAAERWQIGQRTVRREIALGNLRSYRMGRIIRIDPDDLDALFTATDTWGGGAQ